MFDLKWKAPLLERLQREGIETELSPGEIDILLDCELALSLLNDLGTLVSEPDELIWGLLSQIRLPHPTYLQITSDGTARRRLANAAILLRNTGRAYWKNRFSIYWQIDEAWRLYKKDDTERLICLSKRHPWRYEAYQQLLKTRLRENQTSIQPAQETSVSFMDGNDREAIRKVTVTVPEQLIERARQIKFPRPVQRIEAREKEIFDRLSALQTAEQMDEIIEKRGLPSQNWGARIREVCYQVYEDGELQDCEDWSLELDGFAHIPGPTGSHKSSFMQVMAIHMAQQGKRVALVVTDTITSIRMANELNRSFCDQGTGPLAAPIFGRSMRDYHRQRLYSTSAYTENPEDFWWADRWLSPLCLLQGCATSHQLPEPLPVGDEPCEGLMEIRDNKEQRSSCNLVSLCPSQQIYRDILTAPIWITTPGALGAATLPSFVDARRPKLGEFVYEQCHVVVFDEVDTIIDWFDALYSPELSIIGKPNSVFDIADVVIAQQRATNRLQSDGDLRWSQAVRTSTDIGTRIVNHLAKSEHLARRIQSQYFTARRLFEDIAERIVDVGKDVFPNPESLLQTLTGWFTSLHTSDLVNDNVDAVYVLQDNLRSILADGANRSTEFKTSVRRWFQNFVFENDKALMKAFDQAAQQKHQDGETISPDTISSLAESLELALAVVALDQNMRIVFNRWYDTPHQMPSDLERRFFQRVPSHLAGLMPVPPTGRLFGFKYQGDEGQKPTLLAFEYAAMGRHYVQNYHRLRQDVDGIAGPHVIAFSGTSWLPHSSHWHLRVPPKGVFVQSDTSREAIKSSLIEFIPQYRQDRRHYGKPISISGTGEKMHSNLAETVTELVSPKRKNQAQLVKELHELEQLAKKDPENWADRERVLLLVNSYDQVTVVAHAIGSVRQELRSKILGLKRSSKTQEDFWIPYDSLGRGDIEQAGTIEGKQILVAPMQAIGRGYNILNRNKKAAYGTVYFLIRPMPQPNDMRALAREMNYQTFEWIDAGNPAHWLTAPDTLHQAYLNLRREASLLWSRMENKKRAYVHLADLERADLAASTAGLIVQACGRVLRGGVPFRAYFVDAKWAPRNAENVDIDTPQTSLLVAMLGVLRFYVEQHPERAIGQVLYGPLVEALKHTRFVDGSLRFQNEMEYLNGSRH
jgi:hypothetical protein